MIINVLSGKGGAGKSTVSASLAALLSESGPTVAADCDVDTPNLGILFGLEKKDFEMSPVSTGSKAQIDPEKCTNCGKCRGVCVFSAIDFSAGKPAIDRYACEGCGACELVCPHGAIELKSVQNGWVGKGSRGNIGIATGLLRIGQAGSGDIVALVKEKAGELQKELGAEHIVLDSAAGIGCPVIASVRGSDYAVAVTEPTPSALSDLSRAIEVLDYFRVPYGVVVNKSTLNPGYLGSVKEFAESRGSKIIAEIPYDPSFVEAAVEMRPAVAHSPAFRPVFGRILETALSSGKPHL